MPERLCRSHPWCLLRSKSNQHIRRKEMEQTTEELWCSACQCRHPVEAFGVDRASRRGYQKMCREGKAKYRQSDKGKATEAKYRQSDNGRAVRNKIHREYRADTNERAWAVIGITCAWSDLGGCCEAMCKDHIVPVLRRRSTGYTSHGYHLNRWIVDHPTEAKKRIQCLCEVHNYFKNDMPEDEARAKWIAKYPRSSSGQPLSSTDPLLRIAS